MQMRCKWREDRRPGSHGPREDSWCAISPNAPEPVYVFNMARHQLLTRRALLAGAAAYAASGLRGASAGRISLGANTAIAGYGLFEAISLLRDLDFRSSKSTPWACRSPL